MGIQLNVTEWMKGHVGFGAASYEEGERLGKQKATTFQHEVLIQMKDIDRFVAEPRHSAPMDGNVVWLGTTYPFKGGEFNMLIDSTNPRVKHMYYRIPFSDSSGKRMTMLGHKMLRDDPGLDVWEDITTLFIRIYEGDAAGHDFTRPNGPAPEWPDGHVAMGIIHISLRDGFHSALSFDAPGSGRATKAAAIGKFLAFYGQRIVDLYFKQSSSKRLIVALAAVGGVVVVGGLLLARLL
jgi:cholesterol oxidase